MSLLSSFITPLLSLFLFCWNVLVSIARRIVWENPVGIFILSPILGLSDLLFSYLTMGPRNFCDGVGDVELLSECEDLLASNHHQKIPIDVSLSHPSPTLSPASSSSSSLTSIEIEFESPMAKLLPHYSKKVYAMVVLETHIFEDCLQEAGDSGQSEKSTKKWNLTFSQLKRMIKKQKNFTIQLPHTGDNTYNYREEKIAKVLADQGVGSILPLVPLFGKRGDQTKKNPNENIFRTVTEYCVMAQTIAMETLALIDWVIEDCEVSSVILAGISLGGALSSIIGLLCRHDIAIVSSIGCDSPYAIYGEGLLKRSVDHEGLGGGHHLDILKRYNLEALLKYNDKLTSRKTFSLLYGKHDHFVPKAASSAQFELMKNARGVEKARRKGMIGGHSFSIVFPSEYIKEVQKVASEWKEREERRSEEEE